MSADLPEAHTNAPLPTEMLAPDMRALDAALREVLNAAPHQQLSPTAEPDAPLALDATMDVVSRAASTIDELIERNRSITNAAVRSVEFFRAQAAEARAEADKLREEMRIVKEKADLQNVATLAHAQELEAELAARTAELDKAKAWIGDISAQVASLLGDAETRLGETNDGSLFGE